MLFWHKLALAIGGCTVAELKARMSVEEAKNWKRFCKHAGCLGYERTDWHFATLLKMLADVHSLPENQKPAETFLLRFQTDNTDENQVLQNNLMKLAGF